MDDPNDPTSILSEAARQRISDARAEAERIRLRAKHKNVLDRGTYGDYGISDPAALVAQWRKSEKEVIEANFQAAFVYLAAFKTEFQAVLKTSAELRHIMMNESRATANSFGLAQISFDLLWAELGLDRVGLAQNEATARAVEGSFPEANRPGASEQSPSTEPGPAASQPNGNRTDQRAAIEAFISTLSEDGRKITRKDIWTVAGYKDPTEFERFQRGDARTTRGAAAAFNRVLNMEPKDFIQLLEKKSSQK